MTDRVKHLWWRAGMGAPLQSNRFGSEKELLDFLIADASKITSLPGPVKSGSVQDLLKMSLEEKTQAAIKRTDEIRQLNYDWVMRFASNEGVLREKMTLFWSNHFSCRSGNPAFSRQLNQIIRTHALGDFRTLLLEVSKSPAMLQFLNNQQNRKARPNENFAREVMELFTLGRGHYTEEDIREAARAFTGWSFDQEGNFIFRVRVHDEGEKQILGSVGYFKGEDVLNILLEKKQTARFIVEKFWRSFISETPEPERVQQLTDDFYNSRYDILALVKNVFGSDWFYDVKYKGALIKSPIDLMVPLIRDFNVQFANINVLLGFQKVLGQILFNPPNVAGWPGGRNWIDSSSLAVRMRLPGILIKDQVAEFDGKEDADANNPFRERAGSAGGKIVSDWTACYNKFSGVSDEEIFGELSSWLLAIPISERIRALSNAYCQGENRASKIKAMVGFITTLPEYQIC